MKSILSITSFLLIISYSNAQVPNYVPSDSLIGWWGFNGNANDESGNGNDGTINGATLTNDRFGNNDAAYNFDGDDNVFINLLFDEEKRSVFGWFNSSGSTGSNQIFFSNDHNQLSQGATVMGFGDDQTLGMDCGTSSCVNTPSLSYNNWYHAGCVRSTDSVKYYLNGALVCTMVNDSIHSNNPNTGGIFFGCTRLQDRFFNGEIDDFGIWNRALDSCEIIDLYNASVNCTVGLSNQSTSQLKIFPNPTNENLSISLENFNGNINTEVYDLIGNRLQVTNESTISLQDYARGIYVLKVAYGDRVEEVKVIKD
jgi:hypothetical protein